MLKRLFFLNESHSKHIVSVLLLKAKVLNKTTAGSIFRRTQTTYTFWDEVLL